MLDLGMTKIKKKNKGGKVNKKFQIKYTKQRERKKKKIFRVFNDCFFLILHFFYNAFLRVR